MEGDDLYLFERVRIRVCVCVGLVDFTPYQYISGHEIWETIFFIILETKVNVNWIQT